MHCLLDSAGAFLDLSACMGTVTTVQLAWLGACIGLKTGPDGALQWQACSSFGRGVEDGCGRHCAVMLLWLDQLLGALLIRVFCLLAAGCNC